MNKNITLKELQEFIKAKDNKTDRKHAYFMKLVEEVGELGRMIRKHDFEGEPIKEAEKGKIKDTLEEEMYDVLYYVMALANLYDVDMEKCFRLKEDYNGTRTDH